jgi:DNA-binding Lrp family transcriptional regulator
VAKPAIDNTERDRKILALLAATPKLSNEAIGAKFGISRTRVANIRDRRERERRASDARRRIGAKLRADFEKYAKDVTAPKWRPLLF